jgi:hypothetical protein
MVACEVSRQGDDRQLHTGGGRNASKAFGTDETCWLAGTPFTFVAHENRSIRGAGSGPLLWISVVVVGSVRWIGRRRGKKPSERFGCATERFGMSIVVYCLLLSPT